MASVSGSTAQSGRVCLRAENTHMGSTEFQSYWDPWSFADLGEHCLRRVRDPRSKLG